VTGASWGDGKVTLTDYRPGPDPFELDGWRFSVPNLGIKVDGVELMRGIDFEVVAGLVRFAIPPLKGATIEFEGTGPITTPWEGMIHMGIPRPPPRVVRFKRCGDIEGVAGWSR
jgi:hypothetical protein